MCREARNHTVSSSVLKMKERYGLWRRMIQWRRIATDNGNHAKLFNASFASIITKKVSSKQIVIIIDTYD